MLFPATVTITSYNSQDEPIQSEISFGQYAEDLFACVEASDEENAKDEVREVLIAADLGDVEVDKIVVHPAL